MSALSAAVCITIGGDQQYVVCTQCSWMLWPENQIIASRQRNLSYAFCGPWFFHGKSWDSTPSWVTATCFYFLPNSLCIC